MLSEREVLLLGRHAGSPIWQRPTGPPCPHVVPVCFVVSAPTLYVTIDEKPKRRPARLLKRLRNIAENPQVTVVADRYEEDWARLGWVMLTGHADILAHGREHDEAQALLRGRYPQLAAMQIAEHPVIAVRIARVTSWGNLSIDEPSAPYRTRAPPVRRTVLPREPRVLGPGNSGPRTQGPEFCKESSTVH